MDVRRAFALHSGILSATSIATVVLPKAGKLAGAALSDPVARNYGENFKQTGVGTVATCPVGSSSPVSRSMRNVTIVSVS